MARSTLAARVTSAVGVALAAALCGGLMSACGAALAEPTPHPHGSTGSGGSGRGGAGTSRTGASGSTATGGPNGGQAGPGGRNGGAQDGGAQNGDQQNGGGRNGGGQNGGGQQDGGQQDGGRNGGGQNGGGRNGGGHGQNGAGQQDGAQPFTPTGREHPGRTQQGTPKATAPNPNCTLIVPTAPLTAQGLATPYRLTATNRDEGTCHESNADQSAFVEATILDPRTGALSVYHPLVVDDGDDPLVAPVFPSLPPGAVVGVWFGFQGDVLRLRGDTAGCVNGLPGSPFGQFANCGAAAFFTAANASIKAGRTVVPPLGTAVDGKPCPTTRDFSVVDQDQSDNLATTYVSVRGRTAQDNTAARGLPGVKLLTNASDNGLLVAFIDPALGCRPYTAPDLSGDGAQSPSLALNELQAAAFQAAPVAMVPTNDPMALRNDRMSVDKTNLYRQGVNMPALPPGTDNGAAYCADLRQVAPARLALDRQWTARAPSPAPDEARNLFDFLVQRLTASWQELKCRGKAPAVPGAGRGGRGNGDN